MSTLIITYPLQSTTHPLDLSSPLRFDIRPVTSTGRKLVSQGVEPLADDAQDLLLSALLPASTAWTSPVTRATPHRKLDGFHSANENPWTISNAALAGSVGAGFKTGIGSKGMRVSLFQVAQ